MCPACRRGGSSLWLYHSMLLARLRRGSALPSAGQRERRDFGRMSMNEHAPIIPRSNTTHCIIHTRHNELGLHTLFTAPAARCPHRVALNLHTRILQRARPEERYMLRGQWQNILYTNTLSKASRPSMKPPPPNLTPPSLLFAPNTLSPATWTPSNGT